MATLSAPKLGASSKGNVNLPESFFSSDWNEHLVWHVVRNELLARRQGTHSTLTRGNVRGGGAKPWRQKGTGRARQGTRNAPQWAGGGVVFGPSPRSYGGKVNRKERDRAFRVALTMHQSRGSLAVVSDDAFDAASTKAAFGLVNGFDGGKSKKLVVACTLEQENVYRSFRNLTDTQVVPVEELDVADLMWAGALFITESALKRLEGTDA